MKKIVGILLFLALYVNSKSQTSFQNYYDGALFNTSDETFAVSPDACYLIHNLIAPSFASKIIKTDLDGNIIWAKNLGATSGSLGTMRIAYHNNSLFITCAYVDTGYMNLFCKLDTSGNILWTTRIAYGDVNVNARIIPNSAGYLLVGHRDYIGAQSDYTFDITIAQINNSGTLMWARAFGDNNYEFIASAATLMTNGDLMVAGNYGNRTTNLYNAMLARFDAAGDLLWMQTLADASGFYTKFIPNDITKTSDGNFAITGTSYNTNLNYDAQVVKFDSAGNILWGTRIYQVSWQECGNSIISDSNGDLIIAGAYDFAPEYGDFAARLNDSGVLINAAKTSNTTYFSSLNQGEIYEIRGGDLFEVPGSGYIGSTRFHFAANDDRHCIIKTNNLGVINCNALGGTYNCAWQTVNWTPTIFTALPSYQANITATTINITSTLITVISGDICPTSAVENFNEPTGFGLLQNPCSDCFVTGINNEADLSVLDILGRNLNVSFDKTSSGYNFNVQKYSAGIFFIRNSKTGEVVKFVKE